MVHVRINESEPNPNPHINFISALPMIDAEDQEEARQLLRALAAQVRPVMKAHGFAVNSFEEYEFNQVFAGRNWNNGETIELVLRRAGGNFYPNSWLMSTLCHELAHIKHMNHGPAFQALWTRLRSEVRQLQAKGYYGDGYWSSGQRLRDSARVVGDGIDQGEFPEYVCGGAQTRSRPTAPRRRRRARQGPGHVAGQYRQVTPSLHTGRQTTKQRKAGTRVRSKYAFAGDRQALGSGEGNSTSKRATTKKAREERALATERRLRALAGEPSDDVTKRRYEEGDDEEGDEEEEEFEVIPETDSQRREALQASEGAGDVKGNVGTKDLWKQFEEEFGAAFDPGSAGGSSSDLPPVAGPSNSSRQQRTRPSNEAEVIELTDSDGEGPSCDVPVASGSIFTQAKGKSKPSQSLGLGKLVQTEIEFHKKEALGLTPLKGGRGRTLGSKPSIPPPRTSSRALPSEPEKWTCKICTLQNDAAVSTCLACETPRGSAVWAGSSS